MVYKVSLLLTLSPMSKIVLVGLLSVLFVLSGCSLSNVAYATGSVVDQNGVAIQGARVVFDGEGLYLVQFTDEAGNYKIKDLKAGN